MVVGETVDAILSVSGLDALHPVKVKMNTIIKKNSITTFLPID